MIAPREMLVDLYDFWFSNPEDPFWNLNDRVDLWFGKSEEKDRVIKEVFETRLKKFKGCAKTLAPRLEYNLRKKLEAQDKKSILGLVLLLDQVPRHVFRGTPKAFRFDEMALQASHFLLRNHFDAKLNDFEKVFLYLPFQHSEDLHQQRISMHLFQDLRKSSQPQHKEFFKIVEDMSRRHLRAIKDFGRFPHRNSILNRSSQPNEIQFLEDPKNWF